MASIGLTIPAIAIAMIWLPGPLLLGLGGGTQMALTVVVGTLTVVPGRANVLQGGAPWSSWPHSCSWPPARDASRLPARDASPPPGRDASPPPARAAASRVTRRLADAARPTRRSCRP